jgi:membrane-associated protein
MGIGYLLGDLLSTAANYYLYGIVGVIVLISLVPMFIELFREWQSKRYKK